MQKQLLIIEYYKDNNLTGIEIAKFNDRKFEEHIECNIKNYSLVIVKAKAYDYIINQVSNGYEIQNIEKAYMKKCYTLLNH